MNKTNILDTILDNYINHINTTGKEPTKVILGRKQERDITLWLMFNGHTTYPSTSAKDYNQLYGMEVVWEDTSDKLEIS